MSPKRLGLLLFVLLWWSAGELWARPDFASGADGQQGQAAVRVWRSVGKQRQEVVAGAAVKLSWFTPEGQALLSWDSTSDAEGWARFEGVELLAAPNLELRAVVEDGWTRHRSKPLQSSPSGLLGSVLMRPSTGRLENVSVERAITVMRMPADLAHRPEYYGYVEIQQLLVLSVSGDAVFDTELSPRPQDGILIKLPEGATRIDSRLRRGEGKLELGDGVLRLRGVIEPGPEAAVEVAIWFALEADGSSVEFEQELTVDWRNIEFAVLRQTGLERQPWMRVRLDAPGFSELVENPSDDPMWSSQHVQLARGLELRAGEVLRARVRDLPYQGRPVSRVLGVLVLVILAAGAFSFVRALRESRR